VHHDAVEPGVEIRIAPKAFDCRKELQECVLRYILGDCRIAAVAQSDRIHGVLMLLEDRAKGFGFAALTSFDQFSFSVFKHHPARYALINDRRSPDSNPSSI